MLGKWLQKAEGVIFENWKLGKFEEVDNITYGQDYGFSIDPTTLIKVGIDKARKKIFLKEIYFKQGLSTNEIYNLNRLNVEQGLIIADSAEPRLISELKQKGLNIKGAVKGQGSVTGGISLMQGYEIIIDPLSINLIKEFNNYAWSDKKSGTPIDLWNHCFVGSTLIRTDKGDKIIKKIEVGDLVATSNGYNKVNKVFNNGCNKVLHMKISFSTFTVEISGTSDHKIKTTKGWKQLKDLKQGDSLHSFSMEKNTICTMGKSISVKEGTGYIELCGSTITDKFQKVITFITRITTKAITKLRTYFAYTRETITKYIVKPFQLEQVPPNRLNTLKGLDHLQKNGTQVKMVENGIPSMEKDLSKTGLLTELKVATVVEKNIQPTQLAKTQSFAQTNASQSLEEIQELTTKKENASTVKQYSLLINTQEDYIVTENVITDIKIMNESNETVYDLEVDNCHEYFANGILVHNCIDAVRYTVSHAHQNNFEFSIG